MHDEQVFPAAREEAAGQDQRPDQLAGLDKLTDLVAGLARDFDNVLPHLIGALDRDQAFGEISERLRRAEASAEIGLNWVLIDGIHKLLNDTRRLKLDPQFRSAFTPDLRRLLASAGVSEFGRPGDSFDADRHEAIYAAGEGQRFLIAAVHVTGLERAGVVLKRAKVSVERSWDHSERPGRGARGNGEQ